MRGYVTTFLSLVILAIFLSLGTWQVQRLVWKQGILADIDARIGAAPVAIPQSPDPEADRYLPIMVQGVLGKGVSVLASSKSEGPGYRVLTSLTLENGRRVLLDRGFRRLQALPDDGPHSAIKVTGNLYWPNEVDNWTPAPEPQNGLWFARDIPAIAAHLGTEPLLIVARTITPPSDVVHPMPVTSEGIPNRHLEYAVTWFLLAATWVVMTVFALWRIRRRTS